MQTYLSWYFRMPNQFNKSSILKQFSKVDFLEILWKPRNTSTMISTVTILVLTALAAPSLGNNCICRSALKFRGDDTTQYCISEGSPKILKAFTVCSWLSVPEDYVKEHHPTLLSYANRVVPNEIVLSLKPTLVVHLINHPYSTYVAFADGKLHHLCVTWESSSGLLQVFKDGALVKTREDATTEHVEAGGAWVIGQDQDKIGGGFDKIDSFKGNLTEVHVWSRALCPYEISRVAKDCGSLVKGDYKTLSDFKISAAVELETSQMSCCPKAKVNAA